MRLLEGGNTWVKLSAAYRFSASADGFSDAAPVAKELLRVAGRNRVVFATDWPHTRFEGLDIRPWIRTVLFDLCEKGERLIERVFKGNAEELWSTPLLSTES
ncbi:TIM barrel metal-dependent hydrolase [Apiospora kogelbergensis]|uniref:TIM barrel metal-dependent hydrolase n=1 Tax=Apiospora kogelbergensis TaxID=1337665 RepID=UPI0031324B5C